MRNQTYDQPFPLKRYYLVYAGIGGIIFYSILFSLFVRAERQALYDQYVQYLIEKASALYQDVDRDYLKVRKITFQDINAANDQARLELRKEIDEIIKTDFTLANVKIFNRSGRVLYDYTERANEGKPYQSMHESGFKNALNGIPSSKIEQGKGGEKFMEVYLPIYAIDTHSVVGILELYEDVSRFEKRVYQALKQALIVPTIIFFIFNFVLFLIVSKADRIITKNTELLTGIRRNMEKYISPSATKAIYNAVTLKKELFQGERQDIIILFSDIRGFTRYSETTEPEGVVRRLNEVFELQAEIINDKGGIIDKFVGDEIMAIFPADRAAFATRAAIDIVREIRQRQDISFEVGIGIHAGDAVVGSIGTKNRRDYTAIGNTVNTGARLCNACLPGEVIISSRVFEQLSDEGRIGFSPQRKLKLKGKAESIKTYSWNVSQVSENSD